MKISFQQEIRHIFHQHHTNSCTCNAVSSILTFITQRQGYYTFPFSRLYLYYNTRLLQGTVDRDDGCIPSFVFDAIQRYGVCPEEMWPLDETKIFTKPPDMCYDFARRYPFSLSVDTFLFSEQEDWVQTMTRHLGNGNLVLCSMKRDRRQHIGQDGVISTITHDPQWYHSIVAIGIDDEAQNVLFLNSHGIEDEPYEGYFTMTFQQIADLNPIDDEAHVLSGRFEHDTTFGREMMDALLDYHQHPVHALRHQDMIDMGTTIRNSNNEPFPVFDHVIVGAGMTGRYLAYRLRHMFPNDSVLVVDHSNKQNQSLGATTLEGQVLCSGASHYAPYFSKNLRGLLEELGLPRGEIDNDNSSFMSQEFRSNAAYSRFSEIMREEFGVDILDEQDVQNTLFFLFGLPEMGTTFYESFFRLRGLEGEMDSIMKNSRRGELFYPEKPLYYFVEWFCDNYTPVRFTLNDSLSYLLQRLLEGYVSTPLGDFMTDPLCHTHTVVESTTATSWDADKNTCTLQMLSSRTHEPLSSPWTVSFQHLYHASLSADDGECHMQYYSTSIQVNVFLFLDTDSTLFSPTKIADWGTVSFVSPRIVDCRDVHRVFFNQVRILASPIELHNNVLYPLDLFPDLERFVADHRPSFIHSRVVQILCYDYPGQIGFQTLIQDDEPCATLRQRMEAKMNYYGNVHVLNTNYGPLPCEVEGSLVMVDDLLSATMQKTWGIFVVRDGVLSKDVDMLAGVHMPVFYGDDNTGNVEKMEAWLASVDGVLVSGLHDYTRPTTRDVRLFSVLLQRVKEMNSSGVYFPLVAICFGFELLVLCESVNVSDPLHHVDGQDHCTHLFPHHHPRVNRVLARHVSTENPVYFDHGYGFLSSTLLLPDSYEVVHCSTDRSGVDIVATVENTEFPIYGFQWHPFVPRTHDCLNHVKMLKRILFPSHSMKKKSLGV